MRREWRRSVRSMRSWYPSVGVERTELTSLTARPIVKIHMHRVPYRITSGIQGRPINSIAPTYQYSSR